MTTIDVPTRAQVSLANQTLFDDLAKKIGRVPNLLATLAHSETALGNYLAFQTAKSSITGKAREVINLAVSQVNGCDYCLAAHTEIGKLHGFSEPQILELRGGKASFDAKLDALARLVSNLTAQRGHVEPELVAAFLGAGWTRENLVDTIMAVGEKTIINYLHGATRVPVDFPAAPKLAA